VLGEVTIDGAPTHHLRGAVASGGHVVTREIWVRTDHLPPGCVVTQRPAMGACFLIVAVAHNTGATRSISPDAARWRTVPHCRTVGPPDRRAGQRIPACRADGLPSNGERERAGAILPAVAGPRVSLYRSQER
jgi:hypothetical protein